MEQNGLKKSASLVVDWGRERPAEPGAMPLMLLFPSLDYPFSDFARRLFSPFPPTVEPGPSVATPSQGRRLYYYYFIIILINI